MAQTPLSDTFLSRLEGLAAMETLNAELLGSRSATQTLAAWCGRHALAGSVKIEARKIDGAPPPPTDAQRRRLEIGPNEPVRYRHVRLVCGERVLSEAENWYVPSRLTPEMNKTLETTDTPFGKAVAALRFSRQTVDVDLDWAPLPPAWERAPPPLDHPDKPLDVPRVLFTHRAVLYDADRRPFAEVVEHYLRGALPFVLP
jgi:hypothetical protein